MLDVTHLHTDRIQRDDHVIEFGQPACAFRHHPRNKPTRAVSRHDYFKQGEARVNGFGIGPVSEVVALAAVNLGFRRTVGVLLAQMGIHFSLQPGVDRGLQQAAHKLAGIVSRGRQLTDETGKLKGFSSASR